MAENVYKPGDAVPESGIYRVQHSGHRSDHDLTLTRGNTFPRCQRCGDGVRFTAVHTASAKDDEDPSQDEGA
jgi:hypothetical protein